MLKTSEIDRFENFACAKPAGGVKAAFVLTVAFHAIIIGALAAVSISLVPSKEQPGEVEASFTDEPPATVDRFALKLSTTQAPQLSEGATGLQRREMRPAPTHVHVAAIDPPSFELAPPTFNRDFIPVKEKPKPASTASAPPTRRPSTAQPNRKSLPPTRPKPAPFTRATVRNTARPDYPDSARRRGQQGTARVSLSLDPAGNVTAAAISESSGHAALDAAAINAAKRWKFNPATSGGRPVSTKIVVPITFRLN